jgi:hypothetical protein
VVAAQVVDSRYARGWIATRSVEIGLLVPVVVALLGYEVYGIGGGAYGLAFAVLGLAVLDQLQLHNAERVARRATAAKQAARKRAPARTAKAAKPTKTTKAAKPTKAATSSSKRTPT